MAKKKLLKKAKKVKPRVKVAPPAKRHKTKKDYKRVSKVDFNESFDESVAKLLGLDVGDVE